MASGWRLGGLPLCRWGCRGWGRAWHGTWGLLVVVRVVGSPGSIRVCSRCSSFVWVVRGRWLPLGVGIAPALRRVLVRRGTTSMWGCPWRPLVEGSRVERPHGSSRAWSPRAWSNWAEGTLYLLLNELLCMVNLLG